MCDSADSRATVLSSSTVYYRRVGLSLSHTQCLSLSHTHTHTPPTGVQSVPATLLRLGTPPIPATPPPDTLNPKT